MLMGAGGGSSGGGRDVLFRLRIAADPKDWADLKRFGDEAVKVQKNITESAIQQIKREQAEKEKARSNELREILKRDKLIADAHLKGVLSKIDAEKREEQKKLDWLANVRKKSLIMEMQDNERAIREKRQAESLAAKARETELVRLANIERTARSQALMSRVAASQGFAQAGRGAIGLGRGIALASITDEKSAEKMLQTIVAIEASFQALNAGMDIWRGLAMGVENYRKALEAAKTAQAALAATKAAGGVVEAGKSVTGGGAGAGMVGPAAVAAMIGLTLAIRAGIELKTNASRTNYGGPTDRQATSGGSTLGMFGKDSRHRVASALDWAGAIVLGTRTGGFAAEADRLDSEDRLDSQIASNNKLRAERERFGNGYLTTSRMARESAYSRNADRFSRAPGSDTDRAQKTNAADLQVAKEILAINRENEAAAAASGLDREATAMAAKEAELEVKRLLAEQYDLAKRKAEEEVQGAQQTLDLERQKAAAAKQAYEDADNRLKSDEEKFGDMTPLERGKLLEIARKKKAGIALSIEEGQTARGFNAFRDFARESAIGRAKANGAGDVFGEQIAETERLQKESAAAAEKVIKQELTVKQRQELVVNIELDKDGAFRGEFDAIAKEIQERANKELQDAMNTLRKESKSGLQTFAQNLKNQTR